MKRPMTQDRTDTLTDPPTSPASGVISTPPTLIITSHTRDHLQEAYRQVNPSSHQHLPCAQIIQEPSGEGASPLSAEQCTPRSRVSHLPRTLHPEAAPFLWLQGTVMLLCNPEQGGPWRPLGPPHAQQAYLTLWVRQHPRQGNILELAFL